MLWKSYKRLTWDILRLQQGAKRLHFNWDFTNEIEVLSNTEFSQPYCACFQK